MMRTTSERPLSIAILALGGQGGGVLTKWLVDLAEANGYLAQSTYIAGVAQRTGATVYYIEMFPQSRVTATGKAPVFSPTPIPGDVDLVIAGEMAETGRAIQRGFVTPGVTTMISSSHRIYSVTEKSALGDGIVDQSRVAEIASELAKNFIAFDMQEAADASSAIISAVMFGAIAGSGALPFDRAAFAATIRTTKRSVDANLQAFAAGFDGANNEGAFQRAAAGAAGEMPDATPTGDNGVALAERIAADFPDAVQTIALHGALRTLEYQDGAYAASYLAVLSDVLQADRGAGGAEEQYTLTAEVARQLALQMCYEDTIRVGDLKTRRQRFRGIREHVAAEADQPVKVFEYFHPRIEELCDTLPRWLGARVLRSDRIRRMLSPFFKKGRTICTTSIPGFLLLHGIAKLKRFRRGTYRFTTQQAHIDDWLNRVRAALQVDYDLALALAECIEIVKGYGDTYERGLHRYRKTLDSVAVLAKAERAEAVRMLHRAALADEKGRVFSDTLSQLSPAQ